MSSNIERQKVSLIAVAILAIGRVALAEAASSDRAPSAVPAVVAPQPFAYTGSYGLAGYAPAPVAVYAYPAPVYSVYYYAAPVYIPVYSNAYTFHFGPGNYSPYGAGHYRFPYYSYRRPWYFPGPPVFNRNTDLVW